MRTNFWPEYTYRVRIDELGPTSGGEGPRADGGWGEESFKRSNTPQPRVGGLPEVLEVRLIPHFSIYVGCLIFHFFCI